MSGCTCHEQRGRLGERELHIDPTCSIHGEGAQPLPTPSTHPIAHIMVQSDLDARLRLGVERYGQPLRPFNGRNSLRDAYEEALDLCVYLRNALYEAEHS